MIIRLLAACFLMIFPVTALAATLEAPDAVGVGQPFQVRLTSEAPLDGASLEWMGRGTDLAVFHTRDGYEAVAVVGVGLDDPTGDAVLVVKTVGAEGVQRLERAVSVEPRDFPVQKLTVAPKYVTPSKEALERHRKEKGRILEVLHARTRAQYLKRPFVRPVSGIVTSAFGLRRVFNGEPRNPHKGVDLRGKEGTPVKAFAAGKVALTGNFYFAGNCVYLDHGQGVVSVYVHLSSIDVRRGDVVRAGQVVGRVGATGRVTAAHLHFGLYVLDRAVDPLPLLD